MLFQNAVADEKLLKPPCMGLLAIQLRCCKEDCRYKVCWNIPKQFHVGSFSISIISTKPFYLCHCIIYSDKF